MFKIQNKIPKQIILACSGGVDSMSALDFLRRKHDVIVLHINHGTPQANQMESCVADYCAKHSVSRCLIQEIETVHCPTGKSAEEHWRDERYKLIDAASKEMGIPAVTVHHLNDCVETWIWSSMHGTPKIIPYQRNSVIRPFRLTPKDTFINWAKRHNVPYCEDDSNQDINYTRNYVRHVCMPHIKRINPGIEKTVVKKILACEDTE